MKMKAVIFDLDGVLTDTADYHYQAWLILCKEHHLSFDKQMNEQLKGVSRIKSLEIILSENHVESDFNDAEKEAMIQKKNNIYVSLIENITPGDILPGINHFIAAAKQHGVKLAVASASKNAAYVLDKLGLTEHFDYIADAALIRHTKPDPEVFLDCAGHLGIDCADCVGIEDSQAGIEAIKAAGMTSVGIGVAVTTIVPDVVYAGTEELIYRELENELKNL